MEIAPHRNCPIGKAEHARHYLGRDRATGRPQRCEGYAWDPALDGDYWRETGWTGR